MVLFAAQRNYRINDAGAPGRPPAGNESDKAEQDGDGENCERIGRADAVKQIAEQTADGEDERDADDSAERDQPHAFAEDQAQHVAALRAEGEPNADFVRALGDGVTHHAENARGREQQRDAGEKRDQNRVEARLRDR